LTNDHGDQTTTTYKRINSHDVADTSTDSDHVVTTFYYSGETVRSEERRVGTKTRQLMASLTNDQGDQTTTTYKRINSHDVADTSTDSDHVVTTFYYSGETVPDLGILHRTNTPQLMPSLTNDHGDQTTTTYKRINSHDVADTSTDSDHVVTTFYYSGETV